MKSISNLTSISEAANFLKISEELVLKFINYGIIMSVKESSIKKLNDYNLRRLSLAIELHEQCLPLEIIESKLNN